MKLATTTGVVVLLFLLASSQSFPVPIRKSEPDVGPGINDGEDNKGLDGSKGDFEEGGHDGISSKVNIGDRDMFMRGHGMNIETSSKAVAEVVVEAKLEASSSNIGWSSSKASSLGDLSISKTVSPLSKTSSLGLNRDTKFGSLGMSSSFNALGETTTISGYDGSSIPGSLSGVNGLGGLVSTNVRPLTKSSILGLNRDTKFSSLGMSSSFNALGETTTISGYDGSSIPGSPSGFNGLGGLVSTNARPLTKSSILGLNRDTKFSSLGMSSSFNALGETTTISGYDGSSIPGSPSGFNGLGGLVSTNARPLTKSSILGLNRDTKFSSLGMSSSFNALGETTTISGYDGSSIPGSPSGVNGLGGPVSTNVRPLTKSSILGLNRDTKFSSLGMSSSFNALGETTTISGYDGSSIPGSPSGVNGLGGLVSNNVRPLTKSSSLGRSSDLKSLGNLSKSRNISDTSDSNRLGNTEKSLSGRSGSVSVSVAMNLKVIEVNTMSHLSGSRGTMASVEPEAWVLSAETTASLASADTAEPVASVETEKLVMLAPTIDFPKS